MFGFLLNNRVCQLRHLDSHYSALMSTILPRRRFVMSGSVRCGRTQAIGLEITTHWGFGPSICLNRQNGARSLIDAALRHGAESNLRARDAITAGFVRTVDEGLPPRDVKRASLDPSSQEIRRDELAGQHAAEPAVCNHGRGKAVSGDSIFRSLTSRTDQPESSGFVDDLGSDKHPAMLHHRYIPTKSPRSRFPFNSHHVAAARVRASGGEFGVGEMSHTLQNYHWLLEPLSKQTLSRAQRRAQ